MLIMMLMDKHMGVNREQGKSWHEYDRVFVLLKSWISRWLELKRS